MQEGMKIKEERGWSVIYPEGFTVPPPKVWMSSQWFFGIHWFCDIFIFFCLDNKQKISMYGSLPERSIVSWWQSNFFLVYIFCNFIRYAGCLNLAKQLEEIVIKMGVFWNTYQRNIYSQSVFLAFSLTNAFSLSLWHMLELGCTM